MKIAVSYLSSKYNYKKTIKLINKTSADYIHMDLLDGKMAGKKNFNSLTLKKAIKLSKKPLDIHLMVNKPSKYIKFFLKKESVKNIYFHPKEEKNSLDFIEVLNKNNINSGVVIDADEKIDDFFYLLPYVKRVLVMSVQAGYGGQMFLNSSVEKIKNLLEYRKENNLDFKITIDGGISKDIVSKLKNLDIDILVSGSFVCQSDDYEKKINQLKTD